MTGMILQLLDRVCVGKLKYFSASYWAQDDSVLETEAGA